MATIMRDPVILPSSQQTVDRSTIAKHLLSNETDPFNRQPLTLDQVTSNVDLKNKFLIWEKKKKGLALWKKMKQMKEILMNHHLHLHCIRTTKKEKKLLVE